MMNWPLVKAIGLYTLFILACFFLVTQVSAGNYTRPNATNLTAIPTIDPSYYESLESYMATNSSNITNSTDVLPDVLNMSRLAANVYVDVWGNLAWVIIFSIPFLMAWIMGQNVTLPAVMGIIVGGFILYRLPEQFHLVAIGFISLSVIAVVYSLLKERMG